MITSDFRKEMADYFPSNDENTHSWVWQSERKRYEANPTTHALKLAYGLKKSEKFTTLQLQRIYHNLQLLQEQYGLSENVRSKM